MKKVKRFLAIIFVFVVCFSVMTPSAYAQGALSGQSFGAWIASALTALNIVGQVIAPTPVVDPYFQWLNSPTSATTEYQYPVSNTIFSDYLNASTIKVRQGVTTIDGVKYDELWLGPGAANSLKTDVFDFKTKWDVLSGQAGTFAKGTGFGNGLEFYEVGGVVRTQAQVIPLSVGSYSVGTADTMTEIKISGNIVHTQWVHNGQIWDEQPAAQTNLFPIRSYLIKEGDKYRIRNVHNGGLIGGSGLFDFDSFSDRDFQFDYVSGEVPASPAEIPDNYGLSIRIPHDKLQDFYNEYPQYDFNNSTINIEQDNIDIDELTDSIFSLIDSMDNILAEWTNGERPEPIEPIENIDQNVEDITLYQQNMQQNIRDVKDDVQAIHETQLQQQQMQQQQQQTQQQMQQTQQQIQESSESIDNTLKDIKNSLEPGEVTEKKFDLRELFPFCIPFDIYNLLQKFDGSPQAPRVQLPIVIPSIGFSYTLDLDFSPWDPVAATMRTIELIVYALGLAWATSKVIKW